jgi:putative sigma-54 modulation protein
MQVSVTFRHMNPTDALKEFAADKVSRIEKFIHAPTDAHVVLSVEKYLHKAEINISANGVRMRAEETSEDMYSSIDAATSKIERQVKRYRNKLSSHKPREGHAQKVMLNVLEAAREPEPEQAHGHLPPQIIETRELDAKPMVIEEAIMHMDLMHDDFLVFLNAKTNAVNVLYRRKEGTFGLIEAPAR